MIEICKNIIPVLMLLGFGAVLKRVHYFDEPTIRSLNKFISRILLPCVIFDSVFTMDLRTEYLWVSIGFFVLLCIILAFNYSVFRFFHLKRPFFVFFSAAFSFGLSGLPLFQAAFGSEHMDRFVAMGIGHELFFAVVYLTVAQIILKNEPLSVRNASKNLLSPLLYMVVLGLFLNLSGLNRIITNNLLGNCVILFIRKLASITSVLTMIIIGYRLSLSDTGKIKESLTIVGFRYLTVLPIGLLFKLLVLDRFIPYSIDFERAYYTMLSLFGSTMLIILTGQYCSEEDAEVCSNAFAVNVLVSFPVFVLLASIIG